MTQKEIKNIIIHNTIVQIDNSIINGRVHHLKAMEAIDNTLEALEHIDTISKVLNYFDSIHKSITVEKAVGIVKAFNRGEDALKEYLNNCLLKTFHKNGLIQTLYNS